ncbi:hypothetical protein TTY48_17780 [Tsukamurella sp. TY48]|nr:hypothetical protein TTY48_17780 [Tsukamurella sp. TY48]
MLDSVLAALASYTCIAPLPIDTKASPLDESPDSTVAIKSGLSIGGGNEERYYYLSVLEIVRLSK